MTDKIDDVAQRPANSKKVDRSKILGSGIGKIWVSDDWDSPETNAEIARLFNDSKLFPDEP